MPKEGDKYEVRIVVTCAKSGQGSAASETYTTTDHKIENLGYENLVAVQDVVTHVLNGLCELGYVNAGESGAAASEKVKAALRAAAK